VSHEKFSYLRASSFGGYECSNPKNEIAAMRLAQKNCCGSLEPHPQDRAIPVGKMYHSVIASALGSARCVTVIWSIEAAASDWVVEEADEGRKRNSLFPVKVDDAVVPLGFRMIQAADLTGWNGELEHQGLQAFLRSIGQHLGGKRAIPIEEALRLITRFCQHRKVVIEEIGFSGISSSGAQFVSARAKDKMGYIYCHVTGRHLGEVYYVRRGISIYYHEHFGGPASELGLPISNEELVDATKFPTSFFENG
jgi:hypothetical protein